MIVIGNEMGVVVKDDEAVVDVKDDEGVAVVIRLITPFFYSIKAWKRE